VILFDEIEKAHPHVLNILLQVLDDGRLTDTKGRTVNFKNTIIILTSNLKQEELRLHLRPEFINRIDEIITFNDLNEEVIRQIVQLRLSEMMHTLAEQNVQVTVSPNVEDYLVKNGYDPQFGARPIQRLIKREILAALSRYLLEHDGVDQVQISMDGNQVSFQKIVSAAA